VDNIIDVLDAHRYADHVFSDAGVGTLLLTQLLVSCGPRVDCQRLCVANTTERQYQRQTANTGLLTLQG